MSNVDGRTQGIRWPVWAGLALIALTLVAVLLLAGLRFGDSHGQSLPVIGPIADFTLTNQRGARDLAAPGGLGFGTNSLPGANDYPGHEEYGGCKDVGGFKVPVQRAVFVGKVNCVGDGPHVFGGLHGGSGC